MPKNPFRVSDFGAVADGVHLDSPAIQNAIDACARHGGGTVEVGPGVYRCGSMELKSGVRLHLAQGAVILASDRLEDYVSRPAKYGLLRACRARNVIIDGDGAIDGGGRFFHDSDRHHIKPDFAREHTRQGEDYMADEKAALELGPFDFDAKPEAMIVFTECEGVTLRGITLLDSPAWATRIARCCHVYLHGLLIRNNLRIPNSDGLHITATQNVRISDCDITAGDDAIAITTIAAVADTPPDFPEERRCTANVVVTNCVLCSRSAAVRVGYGQWDVRNVVLSNLVIHGSNRGVAVFSRSGGNVSDVLVDNVLMETDLVTGHWWGKAEPIHISAVFGEDQGIEIPGGLTSPGVIENVRFRNISAKSPHGCVVFSGEEGWIRHLVFEQVSLRIKKSQRASAWGGNFDLRPVRDLSLSIFAKDIPALHLERVSDVLVRDFRVEWEEGLPAWHTHAITIEQGRDVCVEGLRGTARHPHLSPVCSRQCQNLKVREG